MKNRSRISNRDARSINIDSYAILFCLLEMRAEKLSREKKQKLRDKVPMLSLAGVRRCRIPFHEALLIELQEGQFENSFDLFSEMIKEDLRRSNVVLTKDKVLMERIFDELKKAEHSAKEKGIEILVELAESVEKISWIAEKIYVKVIAGIKKHNLDATRSASFAQYFFGKFLTGSKERLQEAVSYLEGAFEISYRMEEWTIAGNAEGEQVQLNILIANHLCKALLNISEAIRSQDLQQSLELSRKSLNFTRKAKSDETSLLEVQSLIEVGNCYAFLGENVKALSRFQYSFDLSAHRGFYEIGFEALMKISDCYKELNGEKYKDTLNRGKVFAAEHSLISLKGEVLSRLAKFCISKDRTEEALIYLNESVKILVLKQFEEPEKLQEVRLLMAPLIGKLKVFYADHFSN